MGKKTGYKNSNPASKPRLQKLLDQGLQHHRLGQLQQARLVYEKILADKPRHSDALHLLGVITHQNGQHDEAAELITRAIKVRPGEASYHANLGLCLHAQGLFKQAEQSFRKALALKPDYPEAYCNQGRALHAMEMNERAEACYRKAIALLPGYADAYNNLGALLNESGKPEQAITCFDEAIRLAPGLAEAHHNLGNALQAAGETVAAVNSYTRAIELQMEYPQAYYSLGLALEKLQQPDDACFSYSQAIRQKPDFSLAYERLGHLLNQQGKTDQAATLFRKAIELEPASMSAHLHLADILCQQNHLTEAHALLEQALTLAPGNRDALYLLARLLKDLGRMDESTSCLRQILDSNPDDDEALVAMADNLKSIGDLQEAKAICMVVLKANPRCINAYHCLSQLGTARQDDPGFKVLESLAGETCRDNAMAATLHFTLGKMYADTDNTRAAFHHYQEGNRFRSLCKDSGFNIESQTAEMDAAIEVFDQAFFSHHQDMGIDSATPVFIVGMPRSGTSLVEQILASHPQVYGGGELPYIADLEHRLVQRGQGGSFAKALATLDQQRSTQLARQHLERLKALAPDADYITDKTPGNFLHLWLIAILFPRARIIHCRRDPLDTCLSCFFSDFSRGHGYKNHLDELGRFYRLYQRHMAHWHAVLPLPILDLQYEELVEDVAGQTRRMLDFCGLEWDDACLNFHQNTRPVRTASAVQVRNRIYSSSIGRWKDYKEHLQPLIDALEQD